MTPEDATLYVTDCIINAASTSVPQTSGNLPRRCKPWWNEECASTRKSQNKAWGIFRRYPTFLNLIEFKKKRAKARWTRKQAKRASWTKYISSINSFVTSKEVWDRLKKVRGQYHAFQVPLFPSVSASLTGQANFLAEHFQRVCSSSNYSVEFVKFRSTAEKQTINTSGFNSVAYNRPFTMCELEVALCSRKQSAPGPDRVHYEMLKHLSHESLSHLLSFFNFLWEAAAFPHSWRSAHVIPLLKPGKDPSLATSYRPIALTSCLGKTYERLINRRLMFLLEEKNFFDTA